MRLALLGADAEAVDFIEDALFGSRHELTAAFDVGNFRPTLRNLAPRVRLDEDWETLLLGSAADLVIVGRGQGNLANVTGIPDDERRADQLRKLAQAAVPMLVFCPACEAIIGFEIEMIRRDSRGIMLPYVPNVDPAAGDDLAVLAAAGDESPLGRVEQLVIERKLPVRRRAEVLVQFARDVSLVRRLIGDIRQVSASGAILPAGRDPLGPKLAAPALDNLSVHLQGEMPIGCRWSVGPASGGNSATVTLIGTRDRVVRTFDEGRSGNRAEEVAAVLDDCQRVIASQLPQAMSWLSACRDQEVAEAIDRSLLRGRTIELFNEEHTEEQSFKGVMAMGGCLILMLSLGVLGCVVLVEGLQLPIRRLPLWRFWPGLLLTPIAIFLLMQLLGFAVPKQSAAPAAAKPAAPGK